MQLNRVTITGADDSVDPQELLDLYRHCPFAEWGILVGSEPGPRARFPSVQWMQALADLHWQRPMRLSLHLCGRHVRAICGHRPHLMFPDEHPELFAIFQRVQFNFHGQPHDVRIDNLAMALKPHADRQFIFQVDGANDRLAAAARKAGLNAVPLFDLSHGTGVLPSRWPEAIPDVYCGYAGGLGPGNLPGQLRKIEASAQGQRFWVDMETQVRSAGDTQFDMRKVAACLGACEAFLNIPQVVAPLTQLFTDRK